MTHSGVLFLKNKMVSVKQKKKKQMILDKSFLYTQQRTRRKNANTNATEDSKFFRKICNASEKSLQMIVPSVV
jgi:hypothetical protein